LVRFLDVKEPREGFEVPELYHTEPQLSSYRAYFRHKKPASIANGSDEKETNLRV